VIKNSERWSSLDWLALLGEACSRGVQEGAEDVVKGWAKWDKEQ